MKIFKPIIFTSLVILFTAKTTFAEPMKFFNPTLDSLKAVFANKCNTLKTKINNRVNRFENNEEAHSGVYTKLVDRLSERIAKWKEMGYDVAKLEEDLKKLEDKVEEFTADYKAFIEKLKATINVACGTATEFSDAIASAREALKIVRQDTSDIRNFYHTVIRPDIIELKQQTPAVVEE